MSLAKSRPIIVVGYTVACIGQATLATTVTFTEVSEQAGVRFTHDPLGFLSQGNFPHQNSIGTGVAAVDVNRDGWMDYLVTNGTTPGHYCFVNNGDGTFTDVSERMSIRPDNVGNGIVCADMNNDGRADAFVTNHMAEADFLLGTTFGMSSHGKRFGLKDYRFISIEPPEFGYEGPLDMGVAYGDFDVDGYLDAYATNYLFATDVLWRNLNGGQFINSELIVEPHHGYGCMPVFIDYDRDGDQDIFVVNDLMRDFLYRNDGPRLNPNYTEVALNTRIAGGNSIDAELSMGMGAAVGDFDNDLDEDIYVTNFRANALWLNPGDWSQPDAWFLNVAPERNVDFKLNSWGCSFFDADNDGNLDLFMVGGWVLNGPDPQTREVPNRLWLNNGPPDYDFRNVSRPAGVIDKQFGRSQAVADYDRDGDLDIFVTNVSYYEIGTIGLEPPVEGHTLLYRNDSDGANHWIRFRLQGLGPHENGKGCNRDAVGATVFITTELGEQMRVVRSGSGFMGQDSLDLSFGLGASDVVDRVVVEWPCGKEAEFENLLADQHYRIIEDEPAPVAAPVVLEDFAVVPGRGVLEVRWRTAPDIQIASLRVHRRVPTVDPELPTSFEPLDAPYDYDGIHGVLIDDDVTEGEVYRYRMQLTDRFGNVTVSPILQATARSPRTNRRPTLGQNYPNPFNPSTTITFSLPAPSPVSIVVYDLHGRPVRNLYQADLLPAGDDFEVLWSGNDEEGRPVASGVYYYCMTTNDGMQARRLTLVR